MLLNTNINAEEMVPDEGKTILDSEQKRQRLKELCEEYKRNNAIDASYYEKYPVKRGLRNADGTGVMAGLTQICDVHGYELVDGKKTPAEGRLIYRGIEINEIVDGCTREDRYGFEEVVWLLLFGNLPDRSQLNRLKETIAAFRELPTGFAEDVIMKNPSPNIMNKLARCVLTLYSYDQNPEDNSMENLMRQSMELIARLPTIMVTAYQVKRRYYDHKSMYFHPTKNEHTIAQSILRTLRWDKRFTEEEARLLDVCLILHAEHGGGNNSTFATRVLSSSGTDTYSAIAAGIGSLKGPRHGGANHKVLEMTEYIKEGVTHWDNDGEVKDFLQKLIRREAGDRSGLIYGMGHAIYTLSDPRAVILKKHAINLARQKGYEDEFHLLESVERLTPEVFAGNKGDSKVICANVDLYSGLVYKMLGIPPEMYTPLFAIARIAGWCAHRIEETYSGGRLIRPAYKAVLQTKNYVPMDQR